MFPKRLETITQAGQQHDHDQQRGLALFSTYYLELINIKCSQEQHKQQNTYKVRYLAHGADGCRVKSNAKTKYNQENNCRPGMYFGRAGIVLLKKQITIGV